MRGKELIQNPETMQDIQNRLLWVECSAQAAAMAVFFPPSFKLQV
jgi:hypothetical protein